MDIRSKLGQMARKRGDRTMYIDIYLEWVSRIPRLSSKEERRYLELAKDGDEEAKNRILEANLYLVIKLAKRYINSNMAFLDLVQEGNIGLIYALDKFDLSKGAEFRTYAVWHIRRAIIRALGNKSRTIRVPVHIFEKHLRLKRHIEEYTVKYGHAPNIEQLAKFSQFSADKIRLIFDSLQGLVSLDSAVDSSEDNFSLMEAIEDHSCEKPYDNAIKSELRDHIFNLLSGLTERERNIVQLYYGIAVDDIMTLKELSDIYCLTKERIRQIKVEAIDKIRCAEGIEALRDCIE